MVEKRAMDLNLLNLEKSEIEALHEFEQALIESYPEMIRQIALFGSKARGDAQPESDIDVLVITASDDRAVRAGIIDIASDLSVKYDVLISPRVIGELRWKSRREFLVYQQIREDAVPLS